MNDLEDVRALLKFKANVNATDNLVSVSAEVKE
jgi:hypothetical protein